MNKDLKTTKSTSDKPLIRTFAPLNWYLVIGTLLFILVVAILAHYFLGKNVPAGTKSANESSINNEIANEVQDNKTADQYYQEGKENLVNQRFEEALSDFTRAISLEPKPEYFINKSAAEYNLNKSNEAINTLEEGLNIFHDNEELRSQLDAIKRPPIGNDRN